MRSSIRRQGLAVVLVASAVAGYAGAAAVTALAAPAVEEATGFGEGDGLTRYVLTADAGVAPQDLVAGLGAATGVVSAQVISGDRALVATEGLPPQQLEALPGVADAAFDVSVPVDGTVSDPFFPDYGWHLDNTGSNAPGQSPVVHDADTDAPDAWDLTTGEDVVVAVVDTGFDSDHPDLAGSLWTNPHESCGSVDRDGNGLAGDCHGWNWYTNSADIDNGSHGSHGAGVSGSVGARAGNGLGLAGIAPDVTIMPLVVGGGEGVSIAAGAEAIRYAVDHGADVINTSWGGFFGGPLLDDLRAAVAYAAAHDVLVVVSAGNDGLDRDTTTPRYPSTLPDWNVISVGSSTAGDTVSSFSGYGATVVDLFAPGSNVLTTSNTGDYSIVSGTSFSAPIVAGAVALYRSALPRATAAQVKEALLADVDPVPAFVGKSVTGGRLTLGRLTGTPRESVDYRFTAMTAPAGVVTPGVTATSTAGSGDYAVTVGLGMSHEGQVWAVADAEVTVAGTTVATDDAGTARFPLGSASGPGVLPLSPSMELGDGRYVLTVQLEKDGAPLGRTVAAPLLVGSAVPTPSTPGAPGTGGSAPGTGGSSSPGSGGSGGGSTPSTPSAPTTPSSPGTGGSTPGSGGSGGAGSTPSAPSAPTTPSSPGSPGTGGSTPGTGGSTPGSGGGSTPGTSPEVPSGTPTPTSPEAPSGAGSPGSGTTAPGGTGGGEVTFPNVGPFGITSMSPARVGTAGGETVTVRGTALPVGARVRVGDSASAVVLDAEADQVRFRAPARAAGSYDVHVYAPDGRESVLPSALTYVDAGTGGPGTIGGTPGAGPSTPGGSGASPGGTSPGGTTPGGTGGGGSGSGGSVQPGVTTGPGGQRLVRNATLDGLRGIWSMDCSVSCSGIRI